MHGITIKIIDVHFTCFLNFCNKLCLLIVRAKLNITECYVTFKCCVGQCVSFVRDIEKHNGMYRNKTKHINTHIYTFSVLKAFFF